MSRNRGGRDEYRREARRQLKDAADFSPPLSAKEEEVLRAVADGSYRRFEAGWGTIILDIAMRNPHLAAHDAQDAIRNLAQGVREEVSLHKDYISDEDHALLRRAGRGDVPRAEIEGVRTRYRAVADRIDAERRAMENRAFEAQRAEYVRQAERQAAAEGWVLAPDETLLGRFFDLREAAPSGATVTRCEDQMARMQEIVSATAERRMPDFQRKK